MKDLGYVFRNFFTHKDFLPPADQLPGTLYTPLSFAFEGVLLALIIAVAFYLKKHPEKIKKTFTALWFLLLLGEVLIVAWNSVAAEVNHFDVANDLSLYPCSIFLYALPFVIWGRGALHEMACGYICTLGFLGAAYNFLIPTSKLSDYSCFSFAAFHTFFYHGSMLFAFLVLLLTGIHRYQNVTRLRQFFYPSAFSLLVSVPANLVNLLVRDADYMYFKGRYPWLHHLVGNMPAALVVLLLYALYIMIPACFYLPSYLADRKKAACTETGLTGSSAV